MPAPSAPDPAACLAEARRLLEEITTASLATLSDDGFPFASLVNVALSEERQPLLLLSGLSHHTRHLIRDPRCSLLLQQTGKGDALAHPRLTLIGQAERIEAFAARQRFLAVHPKSKLYADFPDFGFWCMTIARFHLNGGFARAFDGDGEKLSI